MPYLARTSDGVLVRLDTHYTEAMAKIGIGVDWLGQPLEPTQRQKKLHVELFGERVIDVAPFQWYDAEAFLAAEKMPHEWRAIPMASRAEWMAARRIQGMAKTLERYREAKSGILAFRALFPEDGTLHGLEQRVDAALAGDNEEAP